MKEGCITELPSRGTFHTLPIATTFDGSLVVCMFVYFVHLIAIWFY